jgi:hypothetical protein
MSEPQIKKPNAITYPLEDLVEKVINGGVRIPEFQRRFRWQWEDVKRLMESIVRGYPIGSVLLWSRPAEDQILNLGALHIHAHKSDSALWVVDGQQRLTSLANALSKEGFNDSRFGISYNLVRQVFVRPHREQLHVIDLPTLFDLQALLRWFSIHQESIDYFEEATKIAKAIRQYSIPAYIVDQEDELILRDIFDRINNYGKRMTTAEVFSALHGGSDDKTKPQQLADISLDIEAEHSFGNIDEDTILRSILARRGANVARDIRAEFSTRGSSREFPNETAREAYSEGKRALSKAVRFLKETAGVPHFSFLSYRYLLVVLTRFFSYHQKPSPRNIDLLKRWFWRASIAGPTMFKGWTQASRILSSQIRPTSEVDSVQNLLRSIPTEGAYSTVTQRFKSTSSSTRIILCALWSSKPRSFTDGRQYEQEDLGRRLEGNQTPGPILPTIVPSGEPNQIANRFIFLSEVPIELARDIIINRPPTMAEPSWHKLLHSHCIDEAMVEYLLRDDIEAFIDLRKKSISILADTFIESMTGLTFEDTPPLASLIIDEDESD